MAWQCGVRQCDVAGGEPVPPGSARRNDVSGLLFSPISFAGTSSVFFQFHFSVATFSHRRSARIKKLILRKLLKMANNLGLDPFPDPVGHFGAPWRPFWILQVFYVSHRSARMKKIGKYKPSGIRVTRSSPATLHRRTA